MELNHECTYLSYIYIIHIYCTTLRASTYTYHINFIIYNEKCHFCMLYQVYMTGVRYFSRPCPEVDYFYGEIGLEVTLFQLH